MVILTDERDGTSAAVPGERDVLIMRHDVGVEWPNQDEEMMHVNFVIYGDTNKYSAMAATVGYPTAIATKMVLEGNISRATGFVSWSIQCGKFRAQM